MRADFELISQSHLAQSNKENLSMKLCFADDCPKQSAPNKTYSKPQKLKKSERRNVLYELLFKRTQILLPAHF